MLKSIPSPAGVSCTSASKKLEHLYEKSAPSKVDSGAEARHIQEPSLETPASAVEMPPWAESYGFSADAEGEQLYDA